MTSKQFVLFVVAGGIAAGVNFGSRFVYNEWVTFGTAVIMAYITGMITAFILNKLFVFEKSAHSTTKEVFYFTLVNLLAVAQTYLISIWLVDYTLPMIAHGVGIVVPVFTSYFGHKYLSFKPQKGSE